MKRTAGVALSALFPTLFAVCAAMAGEAPSLPETSVAPASPSRIPHARVTVALPPIGGSPEIRGQTGEREYSPSGIRPNPEIFRAGAAESAGAPAMRPDDAIAKIDGGDDAAAPKPGEPEAGGALALASIGGKVITDRDVMRELWRRRGRETLEWLIGKAILDGELAKNHLRIDAAEVEARLAEHLEGLHRAFPNITDPDDLTRAATGMRLEEYRERSVWVELALRKIMHATLKPTDEQLRAYFAERQAEFIRPERVKMSQLFIAPQGLPENDGVPGPADWAAAERHILEAHHRLRRGEDFATVARAYGAGGYASRWLERGELLRELEDAAFSLRPGAISAPLKTAIGFHIIRAEGRQERSLPKLEEVRDTVEKQYEEKRFVLMAGEFMALLRERAAKNGGLVVNETPELFAGGTEANGGTAGFASDAFGARGKE